MRAVKALRLAHLVETEEIQHDIGAFSRLDRLAEQRAVRLSVSLIAVAHFRNYKALLFRNHLLDRLHLRAIDHRRAGALVSGLESKITDDSDFRPLPKRKDSLRVLEKDRALCGCLSGECVMAFDIELLAVALRGFRRRKNSVQKLVDAGIEIFHGEASVLDRCHQLSRGAESGRRHLEVGTRLDCRDVIICAAPVRDYKSVVSPLAAEDFLEQVHALVGVLPVDLVVGSHDRPRASLGDRHLKSRQIDLPQGALVHDSVHRHAALLLGVHGKVLDAGVDALALYALHIRSGHLAGHIGVF